MAMVIPMSSPGARVEHLRGARKRRFRKRYRSYDSRGRLAGKRHISERPAQVLGISDSYGTIAAGKVADLVVLFADPSTDIRNTTKIAYVIKGGKVHKREVAVGSEEKDDSSVKTYSALSGKN